MTGLSPHWQAWQDACESLGIPGIAGNDALLKDFETLYTRMLAYNEKVNLTRITAPEDFLYRHLLDSLVLAPFIPEGAKVADVGSGPGFPALPLAMARPDITVTAIEAVGKKCAFIEEIREVLGLEKRLRVVKGRSDELGRKLEYREKFDVVTARAVARLRILLEYCIPLLDPDGIFLAPKGSATYQDELAESGKALHMLRAELADTVRFDHPKLSGTVLLVFSKIEPTPEKYPRAAGMPVKKPL